jgi:tetratricopeptide (TPR) repeat protein
MWKSFFCKSLKLLVLSYVLLILQPGGASAPFPQVWNMPADNPNFVGRENVLKEISHIFKKTLLKTAVISGPQGFGKSQTAKHYAHQNFWHYDIVWWFRANQYLKPQFEKFALAMASCLGWDKERENAVTTMDHERLISLVKEGIRQKNFKCLIIFDDAQTYADIEPYILFSHDKTIHTLVTTKNGNLSQNSIQIKPFERKTSVKYINIFLANEPQKSKELLANHLSDCPAALALSINYIKSYPGMNIERYLNKHQQQKLSLPLINEFGKKLGSSVDDYETELLAAIRMNMEELKKSSKDAFQLLGLLSLFYCDEVPLDILEKWVSVKSIKSDMVTLIGLLNQYSLVEITKSKNNQEGYLSMQELIQKIINSLIPIDEKKQMIDDAVFLLKDFFSDNADKNAKIIMEDNNPLLHAIKLSQEAESINHHNQALASLRVRLNRILIGRIRDMARAKEIIQHLEADIGNHVKLLLKDEIVYNIDLFLFHRIGSNFEKAIVYAEKALKLCAQQEGMYEEKLRLFANLIQYYGLIGCLDKCQPFITKAEKLFKLSQSATTNAHYIYAMSFFLTEQGEFSKAIELICQNKIYLEKQEGHPFMHFFLRFQLAEAFLKNGDIKKGKNILASTAKLLRDYYEEQDNHFFGKLNVLEAVSKFSDQKSFLEAKSLLERGIIIYEKAYSGSDKHRHQSFAHLQLGKLFYQNQQYPQAKTHYLRSEAIFEKICKSLKVDEVSDLYKQLAILGVDTKNEVLTHIYFKKQVDVFGLDHARTTDILLYLDKKGLALPF